MTWKRWERNLKYGCYGRNMWCGILVVHMEPMIDRGNAHPKSSWNLSHRIMLTLLIIPINLHAKYERVQGLTKYDRLEGSSGSHLPITAIAITAMSILPVNNWIYVCSCLSSSGIHLFNAAEDTINTCHGRFWACNELWRHNTTRNRDKTLCMSSTSFFLREWSQKKCA